MSYLEKIENHIEELLAPSLQGLGYELVSAKIDQKKTSILQIFIDRLDGEPITVGDCRTASKAISPILDLEDPIPNAYRLEISSPGLERPLKKIEHFKKYIDKKVYIETRTPKDGRKKYTGWIKKTDDNKIFVDLLDKENTCFSIDEIKKAHLCYEFEKKQGMK